MPLTRIRKEIDKLDKDLVMLLKKRKDLISKVAQIKKKYKMPLVQKAREVEIDKKLAKFAKEHKLDKKFLKKIWKNLIDESKVIQKKIIK